MTDKKKGAGAPKSGKKKQTTKAVVDTASQLDQAPMLDTADKVVGTLSPAEDTPARTPTAEPAPAPAVSHRKASEPAADAAPPDAPPAPGVLSAGVETTGAELKTERELRVPRGAFLVLRKSGGLSFSTRELVLYPDGRVAYDVRGVAQKDYNRLRRALNDAQVLGLRKQLDQANFWHAASGERQNPDAFAYEIAARLGQRSNSIEVFDGSIPPEMHALLERLEKLLPEE